jgi:hypothetical protein
MGAVSCGSMSLLFQVLVRVRMGVLGVVDGAAPDGGRVEPFLSSDVSTFVSPRGSALALLKI